MPDLEGLVKWEVEGPGSAALRRAWAKLQWSMDTLKHRTWAVEGDMNALRDNTFRLRRMANVVLFELEKGGRFQSGCGTCMDHVLVALREVTGSLGELDVMREADLKTLWDLVGEESRHGGILERRWQLNVGVFRETTQQAKDLARMVDEIMKRVSLWNEVIDGVQHAFRQWELYGEP
ncbi:hypothetical protein B0I37DRAFT_380962 [Chaetomium sp. MPI-CAGE-AT-0009]|nr:hypothetical protein B0I37DRAFT_380962 [Chaetomium sp. MPI-CAGE-AT-0009]